MTSAPDSCAPTGSPNEPALRSATTTSTVAIGNGLGVTTVVGSITANQGDRYSVVLTWFRTNTNPGLIAGQPNWADVDLQITGPGVSLMARSLVNAADPFGNRTWERLEFVAPAAGSYVVNAITNRRAMLPGGVPAASISVGLAVSLLEPAGSGLPTAVATPVTGASTSPCGVSQLVPAPPTTSLPTGLTSATFMPDAWVTYGVVALPMGNESATPQAGVRRVVIRGQFLRSMTVDCDLVGGSLQQFPGSPSCNFPLLSLFRTPVGPSVAKAILHVDAAAGTATAEFPVTSFSVPGACFVVFKATPDMRLFMLRPPSGALNTVTSRVPFLGDIAGTTFSALRKPTTALPPNACPNFDRGSVFFDMEVAFAANPLAYNTGRPSLRAIGRPALGEQYHLVVEAAEQAVPVGSPGIGNAWFLVSAFAAVETQYFPGCWSIFNQATSSSMFFLHPFAGLPTPITNNTSMSIGVAVPLNAGLLGMTFFQQVILATDITGTAQLVPTQQYLAITVGR